MGKVISPGSMLGSSRGAVFALGGSEESLVSLLLHERVVAAVLLVAVRWMGLLLYRREGCGGCAVLTDLISPTSPDTDRGRVPLRQSPICPT